MRKMRILHFSHSTDYWWVLFFSWFQVPFFKYGENELTFFFILLLYSGYYAYFGLLLENVSDKIHWLPFIRYILKIALYPQIRIKPCKQNDLPTDRTIRAVILIISSLNRPSSEPPLNSPSFFDIISRFFWNQLWSLVIRVKI